MRIIVFFDLPTLTAADRRSYSTFRKYLIKTGFIMMQESVYCKLALNTTTADAIMANIKKNKPTDGLVQMLSITEKQYNKMECVVGASNSNTVDSDKRLIII